MASNLFYMGLFPHITDIKKLHRKKQIIDLKNWVVRRPRPRSGGKAHVAREVA